MIPRCSKCQARIGWTRLIRCEHYGQPVLCEVCALKRLQGIRRRGAKIRGKFYADEGDGLGWVR